MNTELLDIQPGELKFVFELNKQSSCSVRLVNKSDHHVAFKVKTTSPKNYCVRPNTGVIKPRSTRDFIVTMQAQRSAPPDMVCKDKFLIQSTVVSVVTLDEDITASTFAKDGKYVEESKLKVILVSPPHSPLLSPINGKLKQGTDYQASVLKDQVPSGVEALISHDTPTRSPVLSPINGTLKQLPVSEVSSTKDLLSGVEAPIPHHNPTHSPVLSPINGTLKQVLVSELSSPQDQVLSGVDAPVPHHNVSEDVHELKPAKTEELKLVKEIEEMKAKLNELESNLAEAEVTISKLIEERKLTAQERESLRQELALLRSKKSVRRVQAGFPLLFVIMVAFIGIVLGYLIRH